MKNLLPIQKRGYIVIFNRPVEWSLNIHIMNWVALESGNGNLQNTLGCSESRKLQPLGRQERVRSLFPKLFFAIAARAYGTKLSESL
jgi:hypothetical protein